MRSGAARRAHNGSEATKDRNNQPHDMLRRRLAEGARGYAQPVTIGTSIVLIAVGAMLKYAVTAETDFIDLQTAGVVLMVVGILGLVLSLLYTFMWSPQAQARARRDDPRNDPDRYEQPTRRY